MSDDEAIIASLNILDDIQNPPPLPETYRQRGALLAKFMGKTKVVAETGAGQHGVALATAENLDDPAILELVGGEG
jgi:hypothetical protein